MVPAAPAAPVTTASSRARPYPAIRTRPVEPDEQQREPRPRDQPESHPASGPARHRPLVRAHRHRHDRGQRQHDPGQRQVGRPLAVDSPASTEKPAEPTADSGPATLNAACRYPRYSANAPSVPARPAPKPQARAAALGPGEAAKGSAAATITVLTTVASKVTEMTEASRDASPAAKSEPP